MTEIRSLPLGAQKIVYTSMARGVVDVLFEGREANMHGHERDPFADEVYCAWTETQTILKPALDGQFDHEVRERIEVFNQEHDRIFKLFAMADEAIEPVRKHEEQLFEGMRTPGICSFMPYCTMDRRAVYVQHVVGVFLKEKEIFGRLELCEPDPSDSEEEDDDDDDDEASEEEESEADEEESEAESEADEEKGAMDSDEESTSTSDGEQERSEEPSDNEEAEGCAPPPLKRRRDSDSENDSEDEAQKAR